jgi:hypothetical protein
MDNYFQIPAISQSALKAFWESPKNYKMFLEGSKTATASMGLGTAIHMAVLEPAKFLETYICPPFGKNATEAFKTANAGKEVLSYTDYQKCLDSAAEVKKACKTNALLKTLFETECDIEKPFFWQDRRTEMDCKAKMDMVAKNGTFILDIKTCQSAANDQFPRDFRKYGYALQAAFYLAGHSANTLPNVSEMGVIVPPDYYILAIESSSPHNICLYKVSEDSIIEGTKKYNEIMRMIYLCEGNFEAGYEFYAENQSFYEL